MLILIGFIVAMNVAFIGLHVGMTSTDPYKPPYLGYALLAISPLAFILCFFIQLNMWGLL